MEISKICPVCHQSFKAKRSTHIYCCSHCRKKHHKEVYYNYHTHQSVEKLTINTHILRQFICKKCKNKVTVINKTDRRTVFCSPHCERLYWKHKKIKTRIYFSVLLDKYYKMIDCIMKCDT